MSDNIKTIRRFNQQYKSFSFSELMKKADDEYLELVVEMDSQGNVVRESKFSPDGELEERSEYVYSKGGKLLEHTLLYAIDDVTERKAYTRDDQDRLLSEVKLYGEDAGERMEYHYGAGDKVNAIVRHDEEGELDYKEEITYDEKGELASRKKYHREGSLIYSLEVKRDVGATIEEHEFELDGTLKALTITAVDADGKEISSVQQNDKGKLISAVYSRYDDRGNLLERNYKDFYSKTIRYEYDEVNRMLTQELFDSTGLLLRKNIYEYDEAGQLAVEQVFEIDTSRGGRDKHYGNRYEYDRF